MLHIIILISSLSNRRKKVFVFFAFILLYILSFWRGIHHIWLTITNLTNFLLRSCLHFTGSITSIRIVSFCLISYSLGFEWASSSEVSRLRHFFSNSLSRFFNYLKALIRCFDLHAPLNFSSNLIRTVFMTSHSQQATRFEFFWLIICFRKSVSDLPKIPWDSDSVDELFFIISEGRTYLIFSFMLGQAYLVA